MNLHEYQAKELLRAAGVPIPPGDIATTPARPPKPSRSATARPVMVKAQVHAGGRGKAGGVKFCKTPADAREKAHRDPRHDDQGPHRREGARHRRRRHRQSEAYVGIIVDRATKKPVFMVSAAGGIDIEEVAATTPEKILYHPVDTRYGLLPFEAMRMGFFLYKDVKLARQAAKIMQQLYAAFMNAGCSLAEINPLVDDAGGRARSPSTARWSSTTTSSIAAPRSRRCATSRREAPSEVDARNANLTFIKLDGNVGCVVNGAGLAMATMDLVKYYGGDPANFLDIGGSSNPGEGRQRAAHHHGRPEREVHPVQHLRRHHAHR